MVSDKGHSQEDFSGLRTRRGGGGGSGTKGRGGEDLRLDLAVEDDLA